MKAINIIVAEGRIVVLNGMVNHLAKRVGQDVGVLGFATNDEEFVKIVKFNRSISPIDLMIIDPSFISSRAIDEARVYTPGMKFIAVSDYSNESDVINAITLGAKAYILSNRFVGEVDSAIKVVLAGEWHHNEMLDSALDKIKRDSMKGEIVLTDLEQSTLNCLACGLNDDEISVELSKKVTTVKVYKRNLFYKFDVTSVYDLLESAQKLNFLD